MMTWFKLLNTPEATLTLKQDQPTRKKIKSATTAPNTSEKIYPSSELLLYLTMPKNNLTYEQLESLIAASKVAHLNPLPKKVKPLNQKTHKYNAQKVTRHNITFDSCKEANRYDILLAMQSGNLISNLQTQVPFELNPGGTHSLKYYADFTYTDNTTNQYTVEDAKGFKTTTYKKKKKLMSKIHQITIKEV